MRDRESHVVKQAVKLGPVQETLLIPLLGRAEETRKRNGFMQDPKALEIVESLDYDFDKWRGGRSLAGATLRTLIYDAQVRRFLERHPSGTVVEIGAGLNTRYERLDNGRAQWLEFDLADSMALRRRFFADNERRTMIEASVLETDWLEQVASRPAPYLFVSEAVIIYLDTGEAERVLLTLGQRFPGSWLLTDTVSGKMVDQQHRHDAMRHLGRNSWFRWRCDNPRDLERLGMCLVESLGFLDAPRELIERMPLKYRWLIRYAPWLVRRMTAGLWINRFRLGP